MTKIWVVEAGQYSDYHIEAICSTKEIAEEWARLHNSLANSYDSASVQEWDSIIAMPVINRVTVRYAILNTGTGEEEYREDGYCHDGVGERKTRAKIVRALNTYVTRKVTDESKKQYRGSSRDDAVRLTVSGTNTTPERLEKALDDYVAEWRAEHAGVKV